MDTETLEGGFKELDELSQAEYRETLAEVLTDQISEHCRAIRLGRLVGVLLKQPFAEPETLTHPSFPTGAYRAWRLVDAGKFQLLATTTWQYKVLEQMQRDLSSEERQLAHYSLYQFAVDAQHERGFFAFFALTLRKYICGDKRIRNRVEDALKALGKAGGAKVPPITPETIVGAGGLILGVYLVQNIPILGMVGAPVVAALVVILYALGVDAFCQWSANLRTAEDEENRRRDSS